MAVVSKQIFELSQLKFFEVFKKISKQENMEKKWPLSEKHKTFRHIPKNFEFSYSFWRGGDSKQSI